MNDVKMMKINVTAGSLRPFLCPELLYVTVFIIALFVEAGTVTTDV